MTQPRWFVALVMVLTLPWLVVAFAVLIALAVQAWSWL